MLSLPQLEAEEVGKPRLGKTAAACLCIPCIVVSLTFCSFFFSPVGHYPKDVGCSCPALSGLGGRMTFELILSRTRFDQLIYLESVGDFFFFKLGPNYSQQQRGKCGGIAITLHYELGC